jgi:hypothetical protein
VQEDTAQLEERKMSPALKRRCCNSCAIALALAWSTLVVYTAIDYIQNSGAKAPVAGRVVASSGSLYH